MSTGRTVLSRKRSLYVLAEVNKGIVSNPSGLLSCMTIKVIHRAAANLILTLTFTRPLPDSAEPRLSH